MRCATCLKISNWPKIFEVVLALRRVLRLEVTVVKTAQLPICWIVQYLFTQLDSINLFQTSTTTFDFSSLLFSSPCTLSWAYLTHHHLVYLCFSTVQLSHRQYSKYCDTLLYLQEYLINMASHQSRDSNGFRKPTPTLRAHEETVDNVMTPRAVKVSKASLPMVMPY